MQQHDVERTIRGLLSDLGAQMTLVLVERANTGWRVVLKTDSGPKDVVLVDGPAAVMRAQLVRHLEFETY